MAKPPTDPRLQRCLTRLEHLFASWEECNGKPDNHRKDDTEALFEDAYILPTKIFSLERKEQDIKNKLAKLEEVLGSIHARMDVFLLDDPQYYALHQEREVAVEEQQRLSEEHWSVLAEMEKSKETSDKAMETNMEILDERHELEWFGRILDHIEPS
ncbi:hypothetical protein D6D24_03024 [Aureobasidium pullulans]|uniref:Uncharacterized protein n=1 Tax=Aureobasidium pullulans TaxID=5580 RepID=A0A4S8W2I5_AURPU|nr:hypothetical protein D6D24_03024 [Aureobasidium pullulans]